MVFYLLLILSVYFHTIAIIEDNNNNLEAYFTSQFIGKNAILNVRARLKMVTLFFVFVFYFQMKKKKN